MESIALCLSKRTGLCFRTASEVGYMRISTVRVETEMQFLPKSIALDENHRMLGEIKLNVFLIGQ